MAGKRGTGRGAASGGRAPAIAEGQILAAAIELLSHEGLQQLTMRRLAASLQIKAASLYWHVRDKAELLQLLSEEVCGRIRLPAPSLPWTERVLQAARQYRAAMLAVRDSPRIMIETLPATPKRVALIDAIFAALVDAGLPLEKVGIAGALLNNYVIAFVMDEQHLADRPAQAAPGAFDIRAFLESAPAGAYPTFRRLTTIPNPIGKDEEFEFGLEVLLGGYGAVLAGAGSREEPR